MIVIAVGVPTQRPVAVGDIFAGRAALAHLQRRDAVFVGTEIAVQATQTEGGAQVRQPRLQITRRQRVPGVAAGIERHVGAAAAVEDRLMLGLARPSWRGEFHQQIVDTPRPPNQFRVAPAKISFQIIGIERATLRNTEC